MEVILEAITAVMTQLIEGRKEIRLGSLTPKRDFNFVLDTVDGFLRAGEKAGGLLPLTLTR